MAEESSKRKKLSHIDGAGKAAMVDVTAKETTRREASVRGVVFLEPSTIQQIRHNQTSKGDVLAVARLAGIMAGKKTGDLIPLCHPLPVDHIGLQFAFGTSWIAIEGSAKTSAKTGVEMEALVAVSIAAATIYDMVKAVDQSAHIGPVFLQEKRGGKSGVYVNETPPANTPNLTDAVWI